MNLQELRDQLASLDLKEVGNWPTPVKAVVIALLCAVVLAAGFWVDTRNQLEALEKARQKEVQLKRTFEAKQAKAANLAVYRQQMEEMRRSFGTMLRQLPSRTEIAELLVDITQAGLVNGLRFELFKPEDEKPAEFYAELPIHIKVVGTYHQFGRFVSDVARLPRIVTLHDVHIERVKGKDGKDGDAGKLVMEAIAKTYRYLEEEAP
ncbi:MAG: pilus assembly protein PilO [Gammaproteobacteria bacterium]|nr:MAG: pilus assembly protein PilO [Gammaproteobacteria bacterium]